MNRTCASIGVLKCSRPIARGREYFAGNHKDVGSRPRDQSFRIHAAAAKAPKAGQRKSK